jgi:hypothetical protein
MPAVFGALRLRGFIVGGLGISRSEGTAGSTGTGVGGTTADILYRLKSSHFRIYLR